jgi:hypothetical protein
MEVVHMYVNTKMIPVETLPGNGGGGGVVKESREQRRERKESSEGGEFKYDIFDTL